MPFYCTSYEKCFERKLFQTFFKYREKFKNFWIQPKVHNFFEDFEDEEEIWIMSYYLYGKHCFLMKTFSLTKQNHILIFTNIINSNIDLGIEERLLTWDLESQSLVTSVKQLIINANEENISDYNQHKNESIFFFSSYLMYEKFWSTYSFAQFFYKFCSDITTRVLFNWE